MIQLILIFTQLLMYAISIYRMLLLVYFLLSWLPGAYDSGLGRLLVRICEPYVGVFRQFIPPIGRISFAGLVAYFVLFLVEDGILALSSIIIQILI